jgi:hypothetical protein
VAEEAELAAVAEEAELAAVVEEAELAAVVCAGGFTRPARQCQLQLARP